MMNEKIEAKGIQNITSWFDRDTGELHIGDSILPYYDVAPFAQFINEVCIPLIEEKQDQYQRFEYWNLFMNDYYARISAIRGDPIPKEDNK